ncbi:MAG: transglutaminase domain-containing protein, partial [Eubacteriales bacterium]|nr:transglutaminase domain-containing protein [Eubacteriales bacterium]
MKKALKNVLWIMLLIIVVFLYYEKDRVIDQVMPILSDKKLVEARELNEQTPEGYTFYYDQLTDKEKTAYRAVLYGVLQEQDEFYIGDDYTKEGLKRIMYAFTYDYPEYYWCLQYQMKIIAGQAYYIILDREEDQKEISGQLESEAAKIVKKVLKQKGKYKQIKAIYDYIIQNTDYVENSRYDQDIRSVLLFQQSVCSGYAKTFQYLCKLA